MRGKESIGKGEEQAAKRHQHPRPLQRRQPLAGNEEMQPERGERRGEEDEHRHARGMRVPEPGVNENEFEREKQPGCNACGQSAVAPEQGLFRQKSPNQQQQRREDRADRRLHHQRHVRGDPFDGDLLETPQGGQQQHRRERSCVERRTVLTHAGNSGVTWVDGFEEKGRCFT